jgi:hypothetical protein
MPKKFLAKWCRFSPFSPRLTPAYPTPALAQAGGELGADFGTLGGQLFPAQPWQSPGSRFGIGHPTPKIATPFQGIDLTHSHKVGCWAVGLLGCRRNLGPKFIPFHHRNLDASQPSGSRDPAPPLLSAAQARLSFGSGLFTLFTRRGAVKTHLTNF